MAGKKVHKKEEAHVFTKKELDVPATPKAERPLEIEKNMESASVIEKKEKGIKEIKEKIMVDEERIDEQITEIYENADGSVPDMKHFERRERRRLVTALGALGGACLFLAGTVWAGFFVFQSSADFAGKEVVLSIAGASEVTAGEEVRYRIRYRNGERVDLQGVKLQVRYPDGFVLLESSVPRSNEATDEWEIGALPAEASGFIDLYGRLYGALGEEQSFRVFLNYTPANFSSEFQQVAILNTTFTAVPVELVVEGREAVVAGGDATIAVKLAPKGEGGISNLAVEVDGGGVFSIKPKESTKADKFFTNRWSFPTLSEPAEIMVRGAITPTTTESGGNITVRLLGWKDDKRSSPPYVYQVVTHTLSILQTDLAANLVINGSTGDFSVQPGEVLNGTVVLRNAGETPLKQVSARLILDAPSVKRQSLLKWAELDDARNGEVAGEQLNAERRRGTITWDRRHVLDLRQLDPKEELVIDFGLPLKSAEDVALTEFPSGAIDVTLEVQYESAGKKETFSTTPLSLTVNSDTALEVRHQTATENAARHLVSWVVSNSFHELEGVRLEADLYGKIELDREAMTIPGGEVAYNTSTQKLVWTVAKMPTSVDVLALQFSFRQLESNPTQTQLVSKVRFEATDTITGQVIRKAGDGVSLSAAAQADSREEE